MNKEDYKELVETILNVEVYYTKLNTSPEKEYYLKYKKFKSQAKFNMPISIENGKSLVIYLFMTGSFENIIHPLSYEKTRRVQTRYSLFYTTTSCPFQIESRKSYSRI